MFQLFQRPTCPLLRDSSDIEYYDPEYMSIDDPLDAFDGDPEAYNDWLLS